jgi:hypothetical protein
MIEIEDSQYEDYINVEQNHKHWFFYWWIFAKFQPQKYYSYLSKGIFVTKMAQITKFHEKIFSNRQKKNFKKSFCIKISIWCITKCSYF